ncbi:T-complex protein 11 homolog [Phtheirospermum japonicum]|uniref:T-complex protein 11 homolog n=1 Tax=Phtheirospermum japonicum TaxID=374723 RepID=A0A830DDV3_9LAMI|nr:T-complex protein 11 homolog [Phtheirospermum japonicum]
MESPERGRPVAGIAMEFPASDGVFSCSPPTMPPWLRKRLSEPKTPPPSTVEEIQAKLREADLRRQKFYESLSSKARPKPKSPSRSSSQEDDPGQRLEAKLLAAEEKRLSIQKSAQMRLAKLDELRQAAKTQVEMRFKKERDELGTKVEMRVRQAEANRLRILRAHRQRRATLKERVSQSLMRRMARENKYKERVCAAISQKRADAEKKRLGLLEAEKRRARDRVLQVQKVASSISYQREVERSEMKDKLEDRLQRARRNRAEYLKQRGRPYNVLYNSSWDSIHEDAEILAIKLSRCWREFTKLNNTTADLARAYNDLNINERSVKSLPFDQFALLIQSTATLHTTKALLDRLETRFQISRSTRNSSGCDDIDHLLKRVASPKKKDAPRKAAPSREGKKSLSARQAAKIKPVHLSRYQVRIVLCAYMILGHPDAVISGRGERETALVKSAEKFVKEFDLLIKMLLNGPLQVSDEESGHVILTRRTFRFQLAAFDSAWCSFLNSFVVWKSKDARSLEEDLVRAACRLELSMIQTCKMTPEGDSAPLSHDMKAIQKQVSEDQKLLREKVLHLSGDAGIERMEDALSDTRTKFFKARENGSPITPLTPLMLSPTPASSSSLVSSEKANNSTVASQKQSLVVRSLFKDEVVPKEVSSSMSSPGVSQSSSGSLDMDNLRIVNEYVHGEHLALADNSSSAAGEYQEDVMVSEFAMQFHVIILTCISIKKTEISFLDKAKIKESMEKAFWDGVVESVKQNKPDYTRVVELMREVRDGICALAPQRWRGEINEAIDLEILTQVLNSGKLDIDYLGKILEYALITLRKLSAPAYEDELKEKHKQFMKDLADTCRASIGLQSSQVVALIKGLRFVLEQIQDLKREISKARIRMLEPLLKGPEALYYLGKAFASRYGQPSNALIALPSTAKWLSSAREGKDEEWNEHKSSLSELTKKQGSSPNYLPSTTLRTGGSSLVKMTGSHADATSPAKPTNYIETIDPHLECKGEEIDLLVRLGLLKLRMVSSQAQMDSILSGSFKRLSTCLDSVADAGIPDIVEILTSSATEEDDNKRLDANKHQSMKEIMSRMLSKSLQEEDAVFTRVSRAVYVAVRGVVLGGTGKQGRELAEVALQKVGAALLLDEVVEAAAVLVVTAKVSVIVHGPWYANLTKE